MVYILIILSLMLIVGFMIALQTTQLFDSHDNPVRGPGLSAVEFPEQTLVIAKDQPQYRPLPAKIIDNPEGDVITCWQMSWLDRLTILFTGRLWCSIWTFQGPLQPLYFTVRKRDVLQKTPNV